jgi:hypothetical protein
MTERDRIIGKVIGPNSLRASGRVFQCWTSAKSPAVKPHPLDLSGFMGQDVEVSGCLNDDIWEARFVGVIHKESHQVKENSTGTISCYTSGSMGYGMGW